MQKIAVFGDEQEDQAVNGAEQLVKEVGHGQLPVGEPPGKSGVRWMDKNALAESEQCLSNSAAQALPSRDFLFAAGLAPTLQSAVGRGCS